MEGYRNIMLRYGDGNKRIWPTEFGWAAGRRGNRGTSTPKITHLMNKRNGPSGPIR